MKQLLICPATSYSRKGNPLTTIGAEKLNFRVRDGNGCDLLAIIAGPYELFQFILSKLDNVVRRPSIYYCLAPAPRGYKTSLPSATISQHQLENTSRCVSFILLRGGSSFYAA